MSFRFTVTPGTSRWLRIAAACGVFSALCLWVHIPLLGGKVLAARDLYRIFLPDTTLLQQAFAEGTLPLWNPYQRLGQPFIASLYSQALYPPRWLCALLFRPELAVTFQHLLHVGIAALGIDRACRRLGCSPVAAFTAATAVALSPFFLNLAAEQNLVSAFAWTGFLVVSADRLAAHPERRAVAGVGLWVALSLLAGSPEVTLWQALLAGLIVLFGPARRSAVPALGAGGLLGTLLAGAMVLPGIEWARGTDRAEGLHQALAWSGSLSNLLGFGWLFADQPIDFSATSSEQQFLLGTFVGAILGALSLVGLALSIRHPRPRALAVGAVLFSLLSLGENFAPSAFVLSLPPFSLFRYPVKYYLGLVFCLAVLAAFGLDTLAAWHRHLTRRHRVFLRIAAGTLLAAALGGPASGGLGCRWGPEPGLGSSGAPGPC